MLLGARHFADTQGASYRPLFGILLDMVGERDARFLGSRTASLCARGRAPGMGHRRGPGPRGLLPAGDGPRRERRSRRAQQAGIRTIDIIDFDYPYWHALEDTPDKVDAATLAAVGDVVLAVIRHQGGQQP